MTDLAAFLAARLDEDEANARDAETQWLSTHITIDPGSLVLVKFYRDHDPARVLREVAAKRAILAEVVPTIQGMDDQIIWEWSSNPAEAVADAHLPLLKIMAAEYSDHPDYDPAWETSPRGPFLRKETGQ